MRKAGGEASQALHRAGPWSLASFWVASNRACGVTVGVQWVHVDCAGQEVVSMAVRTSSPHVSPAITSTLFCATVTGLSFPLKFLEDRS